MQFLLPLFNAYLQKVKPGQWGSGLSLAAGILRRPENFHWAHSWFITYEFCAFESIRDSRSGSGQFPCHKRLNSAISGGSITHPSCTSQLYSHPVKYLSGTAASCSLQPVQWDLQWNAACKHPNFSIWIWTALNSVVANVISLCDLGSRL